MNNRGAARSAQPFENKGASKANDKPREQVQDIQKEIDEDIPKNVPQNQSKDSLPKILENIEAFWGALVNEMISARPLLGNHFQETHLKIAPDKVTEIEILFKKESRYLFVLSDKPLLKYVKNLLLEKIEGLEPCNLKVTYEKPVDVTPEVVKNSKEIEDSEDPELTEQELVDKEPIIGYILKKFDGTLME